MSVLDDVSVKPDPIAADNPPGEGLPQEVKPLVDAAVKLLYDENFESLIKMFKQHGRDGFPQAMSIALIGVLDRLEEDHGELSLEVIGQVGTHLFEMLLEDLLQGGAIEEVDQEDVLDAIQLTLEGWARQHPDRVDKQATAAVMNEMASEIQDG